MGATLLRSSWARHEQRLNPMVLRYFRLVLA